MINVDLQQLVQALDAASKHDLECAAERCVMNVDSHHLAVQVRCHGDGIQ